MGVKNILGFKTYHVLFLLTLLMLLFFASKLFSRPSSTVPSTSTSSIDTVRVLYSRAVDTGESSLCDEITDPDIQAYCRVIANENITAESDCAGIGGSVLHDQCYEQIAYRTSSVDYCSKISGEGRRGICSLKLTGDMSYCSALKTVSGRDECIAHYIMFINKDDSIGCDLINNTRKREHCQYYVKLRKDAS